jgi:activator of 2-hydroxyglutaryl-CoA dehydratase
MICAGVDAGSRAIKIVLIDADNKQVIASGVTDQGVEQNKLALQLFGRLLTDNHVKKEDVRRIVATGNYVSGCGCATACIVGHDNY